MGGVPLMTLVSGPSESRARADAELEEALHPCRLPRLEQVTLVAVGPQGSPVTVPFPRIHAHTCARASPGAQLLSWRRPESPSPCSWCCWWLWYRPAERLSRGW